MAVDLATHDCVAQALSRLPAHLQRQRWQELTEAIAAEIQEVDDAVVAISLQLHLDRAEGAMLDLIGREVREDRSGRGDADYRHGIYIRVVALRSRALAEDVLRVVRMVLDSAVKTVTLATTGPATAALAIAGPEGMTSDEATRLTEYSRATVAGGVRLLIETSEAPDAETFRFELAGADGLGFAGTPPVIDLEPWCGGSGYDAIVGFRDWGEDASGYYTLAFIEDAGAPDAGSLAEGGYPDIEFTYKPGVTTVADFEAAVATSTWLFIHIAGTVPGSTALVDAFTDVFGYATGGSGGRLARVQE